MKRYLSLVGSSALFKGIESCDTESLLNCLRARLQTFSKDAFIFRRGDNNSLMGIVLEGSVRIERTDWWGNRTILASFSPGQSFGEVFACERQLPFDIDVVAAETSKILLIDLRKITEVCSNTCAFHTQLIRNLLALVARRNYQLTRKIEHMSKRTTRYKLLSYLSDQGSRAHSQQFTIPFNRQELADFLAVERSAMCSELSKMKREGIIDYHKNRFEILRNEGVS